MNIIASKMSMFYTCAPLQMWNLKISQNNLADLVILALWSTRVETTTARQACANKGWSLQKNKTTVMQTEKNLEAEEEPRFWVSYISTAKWGKKSNQWSWKAC